MKKARANNITPAGIVVPGAALFDAPQFSSTQVTQSTSVQAAPPPTTRPAEAGNESAASSTITQSNLLIINTSQIDSIAANGNLGTFYQKSTLLKLAEIAYSKRDLIALEHISAQLLTLPDELAQCAGLYYSAIVAKRVGDTSQAISLLQSVATIPIIRARAIQTLGAIEFEAGRFESALPLFVEAARAANGIDVATSLNALYQVSAIKSIAGNHQEALADLLDLWPIVRAVKALHPHLYSNWHNDTAFELMRLGRIEQAREALAVAAASPVAANYPEYQDTAGEIERHARRKIIITARAIRKTQKVAVAFCLLFLVKRRILTIHRLRFPSRIARTILERITDCAPTHAPPCKRK